MDKKGYTMNRLVVLLLVCLKSVDFEMTVQSYKQILISSECFGRFCVFWVQSDFETGSAEEKPASDMAAPTL